MCFWPSFCYFRKLFGFVAKKGASRSENQCHILAELEPEQPATAIVNFVTKVMMTSVNRSSLVWEYESLEYLENHIYEMNF